MTSPVTPNPLIHDNRAGNTALTDPSAMLNSVIRLFTEIPKIIIEGAIAFIKEVTGIDLTGVEQFFNSFTSLISSGVVGVLDFVRAIIQPLVDAIIAILGPIPIVGTVIETLASFLGLTHTTANTAAATATAATTTVGGVIDGIVNGIFGLFGVGWGVPDAKAAAAALAAQQAATAAGVAALQQQSSTAAQSGTSVFVDFSTMADATSLGADFAQFYSGAGTNTWGIASGKATVIAPAGITGGGRVVSAVYTTADTFTDYQRVSAVFSSSQMVTQFGFSFSPGFAYGFNYIDGRCDATGTNCIRVIFGNGTLWFGAVIGGVWTQWTTKAHTFKPGAIYSLDCGTSGGIRQYKVLCNSVPVLVWTEVGASSLLGASYRKGGLGTEWQLLPDGGGALWYAGPGTVAAFAVADTTLPALIGSIGRAFRGSSTSGLAGVASTGYAPVPSGLFDTIEYASMDLSFNTTTGTWTVTKRGNYLISAQMACDLTNQNGYPMVYVNGIPRVYGNSSIYSTVNCNIELNPGDYVQLGYHAITALNIVGNAAGVVTWFQIARVTEDVVS